MSFLRVQSHPPPFPPHHTPTFQVREFYHLRFRRLIKLYLRVFLNSFFNPDFFFPSIENSFKSSQEIRSPKYFFLCYHLIQNLLLLRQIMDQFAFQGDERSYKTVLALLVLVSENTVMWSYVQSKVCASLYIWAIYYCHCVKRMRNQLL